MSNPTIQRLLCTTLFALTVGLMPIDTFQFFLIVTIYFVYGVIRFNEGIKHEK
jgi:hypothetical protein